MKESKSAEAATKATVWGSDVDGVAGTVATPANKVVDVVRLTVDVVRTRYADVGILSRLVGSWNPVLMHARAAFSILERTFALSVRPSESTRLLARVWDELALLVLVAPVLSTSLWAIVAEWPYLTDASLQRGGIARAPVGPALGAELWRFADLRGRHSWLAPRSIRSDAIENLGLELSLVEAALSHGRSVAVPLGGLPIPHFGAQHVEGVPGVPDPHGARGWGALAA